MALKSLGLMAGALLVNRKQGANAALGTSLVSEASNTCLQANGALPAANAGLTIEACTGGLAQDFYFSDAGTLQAYQNTSCVGAASMLAVAGLRPSVAPCNNDTSQQWEIDSDGVITHIETDLVLDVSGNQTENGTSVILWPRKNQTDLGNQAWQPRLEADTQAPTPPGQPTAQSVSCSAASISWNASTDNDQVATYDIYHDGQYIKTVPGTTLATRIALIPGVRWGLYISARDLAGNVAQASASLFVTPPSCSTDTLPPTAPSNLSAQVRGTSVSLTWDPASDNDAVASYEVLRNDTTAGTLTGSGGLLPDTSFIDSALPASTRFNYTVRARDSQGNVSPISNGVLINTGANCTTPVCGVRQVAVDQDTPWGLVFLPNGQALYSQRDAGRIILLDPESGNQTVAGVVPNVQTTGSEGGLLGLAIARNFTADPWLYIMHTSPTDNRIIRVRMTEANTLDLASQQVLLTGIGRNKNHNGGRLRFGPDDKLYASTGDALNDVSAQDIKTLNGKVLRLNPDGSIPQDNPFGNYVWSYGHRNPQGLTFDRYNQLWEQEFGNTIQDDTNLIVKGGNYGWPDCEGTVSEKGDGCATPGFIAPKRVVPVSEGSCSGITTVGDALYIACQRGMRLYRAEINGSALANVEALFVGVYGRLRTVEATPQGNLLMATTNGVNEDTRADNNHELLIEVILQKSA